MISVSPVPDRFLGNSNWDAASWFCSYERMFRSWPGAWGIGGSPRPVMRWSGVCQVLQLLLDCLTEYRCSYIYSSYLGCQLRMPSWLTSPPGILWCTAQGWKLVSTLFHSSTPQLQCLSLSWNHLYTRLGPFFCRVETPLYIHFYQEIWSWRVCHKHASVTFYQAPLMNTYRDVFALELNFIFCEVGTECLIIIQLNFVFQNHDGSKQRRSIPLQSHRDIRV
jgi:hypothetical protein